MVEVCLNNEDEDLGIRMPQQYDGNGEGSDSFQDLFQLLQELFTLLCAGNSKQVPEVMYKKIKQLVFTFLIFLWLAWPVECG